MFDSLITFRSITRAQRGAEVLIQSGIRCRLRRTPAALAEHGCGYVLEVSSAQLSGAVETLRRSELPFQRVYLVQDGAYREMVL